MTLLPARATRVGALALLLTAAAFATGCHITNHDFDREVCREPVGIGSLKTGLESQESDESNSGDSGLFDLTWVPLLYMNIDVFTRTDHEDEPIQPIGYVRGDVRSFLPLFLAWRGGTTLYDDSGEPYEHRFERSFGWGLWKRDYSRVLTKQGVRHQEDTRFLWLLHWGPEIRYEKNEAVSILD